MKKIVERFLDYVILDTSDGLVLAKENSHDYQCHLGNFTDVESAKKYATLYFMIARPEHFATTIVNKLFRKNSGTYHEWFKLKNVLEKEGIEMPKELANHIDGINFMIGYNGKPITLKDE